MKPLKVVFLIDALGWEVVQAFDFAAGLLPQRRPLGTVLGYSSAAIPSLLSGSRPDEHGSWAMYRRADGPSPFSYLKFLPKLPHALDWRARRLARRITDRRGMVKGYYDLYEVPTHLLPYFDIALHQDPYQPGGLSRETVFDRFVANGVRYQLWYYRTPEEANMGELLERIDGDDDVLFLYTAELDALMHIVGISTDRVRDRLKRYEDFMNDVRERAGREGREVNIYVLSDHGMTDVDRDIDIWGALDKAGLRMPKDYLAFFDSTMARFWCRPESEARVRAVAESLGGGKFLTDEELAAYGCSFEDGAYGTSIFLADPGVMIVPSFMGSRRIAAMHGYDPDDRYSLGCFLTDDPGGELPASILGFKDYLFQRLESN